MSWPADAPAPQPAIELDRVTVVRQGTTALSQVSMRVETGERVAVLGASGAGKSTLISLVNGLLEPSDGEVRVLGVKAAGLSSRHRRRHRARIGTLHQQLDLVGPLRVVHNVNAGLLGQWSLPRAAWSLLVPQGVPEAVAALERVGLGERVFDRTDELSGGQQQRVALARVVLQDPELVLADEPVSSLDPALAVRVLELLTGLVAGRTLLASLHNPALAIRFFDRLVGLRGGRVAFDVPADELPPGALDALYA
ncbi:MAG TPA: ATP-binding cassette domain-containing protein [Propionibacteriaceae bacterium]